MLRWRWCCIFPYPEEVEERNDAEVRDCSVVFREFIALGDFLDCGHWDCQLGLCRWVLIVEFFEQMCYWEVERMLGWGGSAGVVMSVQNVFLGDGTESLGD